MPAHNMYGWPSCGCVSVFEYEPCAKYETLRRGCSAEGGKIVNTHDTSVGRLAEAGPPTHLVHPLTMFMRCSRPAKFYIVVIINSKHISRRQFIVIRIRCFTPFLSFVVAIWKRFVPIPNSIVNSEFEPFASLDASSHRPAHSSLHLRIMAHTTVVYSICILHFSFCHLSHYLRDVVWNPCLYV